jgi:hypothetical protein
MLQHRQPRHRFENRMVSGGEFRLPLSIVSACCALEQRERRLFHRRNQIGGFQYEIPARRTRRLASQGGSGAADAGARRARRLCLANGRGHGLTVGADSCW